MNALSKLSLVLFFGYQKRRLKTNYGGWCCGAVG